MLDRIFNNDSIHTQSAYEIEKCMRAREEKRLMLPVDMGIEEAECVKRISSPIKARYAGIFPHPKVLFQTLIGIINK